MMGDHQREAGLVQITRLPDGQIVCFVRVDVSWFRAASSSADNLITETGLCVRVGAWAPV